MVKNGCIKRSLVVCLGLVVCLLAVSCQMEVETRSLKEPKDYLHASEEEAVYETTETKRLHSRGQLTGT